MFCAIEIGGAKNVLTHAILGSIIQVIRYKIRLVGCNCLVHRSGFANPDRAGRGPGTRRVEKYNANSDESGAYTPRPDVRRIVILRTKRCTKQLRLVYATHSTTEKGIFENGKKDGETKQEKDYRT